MEPKRGGEVLKVAEQALAALRDEGVSFEGIAMQLYHPTVRGRGGGEVGGAEE